MSKKENQSNVDIIFKKGVKPERSEADIPTSSLTPKEDKPWTTLKKKLSSGLQEECPAQLVGKNSSAENDENNSDSI